ncbi:unnamed protein product, partial [Meganyctiphanes norvegica]
GEGENGRLLHSPVLISGGRVFYYWKPKDIYHMFTTNYADEILEYEEFEYLSHVEHFGQYELSQRNRSFSPRQLSYFSNSHLYYQSDLNVKVVWFGSRQNPSSHNFYGNVACNITMSIFIECMESLSINVYFVEIVDYKRSSASRFLFSFKKYNHLEIYNQKKKGGAWYENELGKHFFLRKLKRWITSEEGCSHSFEIMLELRDSDYHKVFELCTTEAVDHSDANEMNINGGRKSRRCNHFHRSVCPSGWYRHYTANKLKNISLNFKLDSDSKDDTPSKKIKLENLNLDSGLKSKRRLSFSEKKS